MSNTEFYFWDEMWNEKKENIDKDENEEIITKNSVENEED